MTNLLPKKVLQIARREYAARLVIVCLLAVSFNLFAFALLTIPTDVLIQSLQKNHSSTVEDAMAAEKSFTALKSQINETNSLITLLSDWTDIRCSDLIFILDDFAGQGITISEFNFGKEEGVIMLSGTADSRAGLSGFRNALEASDQFSSAELPLSNLAKDSNIPFTMTVTMNDTKK